MPGVMSEARIVRSLTDVFEISTKNPFSRSGSERISSRFQTLIQQAGCSYEKVSRNLAIVIFIALGCTLLGWPVAGLFLLLAFSLVTYAYVSKKRSKRFADVDRDLPALLTFLASSVRAGLDPMVAILEAHNYLPEGTVLREEVARCAANIKAGETEENCIRTLCDEIPHPDLPLLRSCLLISRRHGTSIAEPLHRVTRVVRQRQSFRRKIRGALVMHRMSAIGIAICAILISLMQFVTNYTAMIAAIQHPVGSKILMGGALLILTGVIWMMSDGTERGEVEDGNRVNSNFYTLARYFMVDSVDNCASENNSC